MPFIRDSVNISCWVVILRCEALLEFKTAIFFDNLTCYFHPVDSFCNLEVRVMEWQDKGVPTC